MEQDELNREFRAIVRSDLERITSDVHEIATKVALLQQSQSAQDTELAEINKSVNRTNNLIERGKGVRWGLLALAALFGGLAGFVKDLFELVNRSGH